MPLQVIVVGAGIAGITAAVALHQAGHEIKIYEKSKFAAEIGAALACAPNGGLALQKLGFDFAQAKGVRLENWEIIDGSSLQQIRNQDISQADEDIGAPFRAIHRNDLFQGLLALTQLSDAPAAHGGKSSIGLVLDARIVHVDAEKGIVQLADGLIQEADLIVAADGVHSAVRPFVVDQTADTSADTGLGAYRFLMPDEVLQQSPAAQRLLARKTSGVALYADTVSADGERHITWYTCRGGELHNFVCIHPKSKGTKKVTDILSRVLQEFGHFHPDIVEVLSLATDVRVWPLLARQPLLSWSRGKAILIGDAAHPVRSLREDLPRSSSHDTLFTDQLVQMLPFGGQGANQAIEDGTALGVFLRDVEPAILPERLLAYVKFRSRRVARIQLLASVMPGNEHLVIERVKEFMEPGLTLPDTGPKRIHHDSAYNVMAEAERVVGTMRP